MYKATIRDKARRLRQQGYTLNEISKRMPFLSKGTVSKWAHDIILTSKQEKRILEKQMRGRIALIKYNKSRHWAAVRNAQCMIAKGLNDVGKLTQRDIMIAGIALYWAEGWNKSKNAIEICNSDPGLIALSMRFFREICGIQNERFRAKVMIHPKLGKKAAVNFWSSVTDIPLDQFHKTYVKPPKSSTRKMHNKLYKGTIKVYIGDTNTRWQIQGFIEALKKK